MAPRVLISDALSPAAIAIFKERGVEVDQHALRQNDQTDVRTTSGTGLLIARGEGAGP